MEHVSQLLRAARSQLGVSVGVLAKRNYCSRSSFYVYEQGKKIPTHMWTIIDVANAYGIDPLELAAAVILDLQEQ